MLNFDYQVGIAIEMPTNYSNLSIPQNTSILCVNNRLTIGITINTITLMFKLRSSRYARDCVGPVALTLISVVELIYISILL